MWATISTSRAAVAVSRYRATASESIVWMRTRSPRISTERTPGRRDERRLVGIGQARPDRSASRQVPDLGGRPIGDDPALPEQDDPVRVGVGLLEVVGGEEHRPAALGVAADGGPEVAAALDVHPGRGLVEGHQRRVGQQGQGEPEALLLAAGALPDEAIGEMA